MGGYGNCMGIGRVGGEVDFDERYEGNGVVNGMCVGLMKDEEMKKGEGKGVGKRVM